MIKDPKIFLHHILECIELLERYTKGLEQNQFESSIQLQDAIFRRFEIIGEATKNISPHLKKKYLEIPWKRMAGMRDVLIHQYYGVSLSETWKVIKEDLPTLKKQIELILPEFGT